jgi:arylsulfatase A
LNLRQSSFLAVSLFLAPTSCAEERAPNVVLILADDLGRECITADDGDPYRTPALDALARAGMRFENCHATPYCTPSRVELMTGRYGFRTGQVTSRLDTTETTFAELLRDAGYATAVAGKWKLCDFEEEPDHPRRSGFDEFRLWSGRDFSNDGRKSSRYWNPSILENGEFLEGVEGRYGPDLYCEFLLDFMRRNRSRPFLAYFPMTLVHGPAKAPPGIGAESGGDAAGDREVFAEMVAYMDHLVGRIVSTLDELGLREETLILFTADNGTLSSRTSGGDDETPGGKGSMTNSGFHVPLIASWPGVVEPGRVASDLIDFSDILPTLAELAGAKAPDVPLDGRSFAPLLRGASYEPRDWVYVQCFDERLVFDGRWKLHHDGRLVDLATDPSEERPLRPGEGGPVERERRARLQALLDSLQ